MRPRRSYIILLPVLLMTSALNGSALEPCSNVLLNAGFEQGTSDTQHINMIIHDFEFVPFDGFIFTDGFDAGAVSSAWTQVGASVRITNDSLFVSPDSAAAAGLMRTQTAHRNERGERYIFSGLLRTASVHTARSGEDVSHLYEWLTPVYWFIGAANSDAASAGSVVWDRTTIGIAGQTEPFPLMSMDMNQGVSFLSSRGFFDARCDIEKTIDLLAPFSPYQTNLAVTTPFFVFTNTIVPGEHAAFYRMRMNDDAQAPGE